MFDLLTMSNESAIIREMLQEMGARPEMPTKRQLNKIVAKVEPQRLEQVKTQLKDVLKRRKQQDVERPEKLIRNDKEVSDLPLNETIVDPSEPNRINRTHVLEMELLKLKGQVQKNKTATMHLKKLIDEREQVKETIKELSSTRREEIELVDAIKRDNSELVQRKNQLEVDLYDMTERMEMVLDSLKETQKSVNEKDMRLQSVEMDKFELRKIIETLELKVKISELEKTQITKAPSDWNLGSVIPIHLLLKGFAFIFLCVSVVYFFNFKNSAVSEVPCKECDYERDIYQTIKI